MTAKTASPWLSQDNLTALAKREARGPAPRNYIWHGFTYADRAGIVHAVFDYAETKGFAVEHVTIGDSEMHVTFRSGACSIYDTANYIDHDGRRVTEICDLPKTSYAS